MSAPLLWLARAVGVVCGGAAALAWSFAMWVPSAGLTLSGMSFVVAFAMTLLALIGAIAAYRAHPTVLVLVFLASFFPVGAFLLTTDHWLRYVGMLDVGMLAAAGLALAARRSRKKPVRATAESTGEVRE